MEKKNIIKAIRLGRPSRMITLPVCSTETDYLFGK